MKDSPPAGSVAGPSHPQNSSGRAAGALAVAALASALGVGRVGAVARRARVFVARARVVGPGRDAGVAGDLVEAHANGDVGAGVRRVVDARVLGHAVEAARELGGLEHLFKEVGSQLDWQGAGVNEKGIDTASGKVLVEIDPRYFRPTEVELLLGDATKAHQKLGWKPKIQLPQLVKEMVAYDLKQATKDEYLKKGGFRVFNFFE